MDLSFEEFITTTYSRLLKLETEAISELVIYLENISEDQRAGHGLKIELLLHDIAKSDSIDYLIQILETHCPFLLAKSNSDNDTEWNQRYQLPQDTIELSDGSEHGWEDPYLDEDLSAQTYVDRSQLAVDKYISREINKQKDHDVPRKVGKQEVSDEDREQDSDMNDLFDELSDTRQINETLLVLIKNVINENPTVESIANMLENIDCFLSVEEREEQAEIINQVGSCLSLHGWQFPGFIVDPNYQSLIDDLSSIIRIQPIRSPYYYDNIA